MSAAHVVYNAPIFARFVSPSKLPCIISRTGQPVYRHSCKLKPLQCYCENSLSSMSEGLEGHDLDAKHSRMLFAAVLINSLSYGVYIMIVHGEI
jgi:hypothetical protein